MSGKSRQARPVIGLIGSASPGREGYEAARQVGRLLARAGAVVICGGLEGVMEAVCRGSAEEGGTSVGLLPGKDHDSANPYVTIPLPTALSHTRNAIIARSARALIAVEGGLGTVSEMALALKMGKRVVGLHTVHSLPGLIKARDPEEAVRLVLENIG